MKKHSDDLLIGFHSVIEAIRANKTIDKILIKKGLTGDLFQECLQLIRTQKLNFQYVPIEKLNRITRTNHQGIIAFSTSITYYDITNLLPSVYEEGRDPFILLLDGITDVRNFGAIARTAEAAGVDAIVIAARKSVSVSADAIKTSAGALTRIPVCKVESIPETIRFLQQSGIKVYGATEKAELNYFEQTYSGPAAIVMGSEDTGISEAVLKRTDALVKIPMMGEIASLNVSVATGVLLFEVLKQRLG